MAPRNAIAVPAPRPDRTPTAVGVARVVAAAVRAARPAATPRVAAKRYGPTMLR
jgi:hypothetical protein